MDKRIKILMISDAVTKTGFSTVSENILRNLPVEDYDISVLGVNYFGDPHSLPYKVYPALQPGSNGDIYGITRLPNLINREHPDIIFILNDVWIIDTYLDAFKKIFERGRPKIVVYFPVDARMHNPDWYRNFDIVDAAVTYTNFAREVAQIACPDREFKIIPHGVDSKNYFKIDAPKSAIKKSLFPNQPDAYEDSFIILNGNRNQPRKQWWITLEAFKLFSDNKPENVKLYVHAGMKDADIDIGKYAELLGIAPRILTSTTRWGPQQISESKLNIVYNACDVGVNTSLGEGWGLVNFEHGVTGAPQVVPENSANVEIYNDCGLLVPTTIDYVITGICTKGSLVRPEDVAERFEWLYQDKGLYTSLSEKTYSKFTSEIYRWSNIAKLWDQVFKETLFT